jgi:hypothetical protein
MVLFNRFDELVLGTKEPLLLEGLLMKFNLSDFWELIAKQVSIRKETAISRWEG